MKNVLLKVRNGLEPMEFRNATVTHNSLYLMITVSDIRAVFTHHFSHQDVAWYTESLPLNNMEII